MKEKLYKGFFGFGIIGLIANSVTALFLLGTGFEGWAEWYSFWYDSYLFSFTFYMPSVILVSGPVIVCASLFLVVGSLYILLKLRNPLAILPACAFIASAYYNSQWTIYFYTIPDPTTFPDPATWLSWWNMLDYGFLVYSFSYLVLASVVFASSMWPVKSDKPMFLGGISVILSAIALYLQFIDSVPTWQPSSVVRSGSQIHLGVFPLLIASVVLIVAFYHIHSHSTN